ncbi:MAG: RlmE family RNA methyltransferase [Myxococcales bacterium]|nr:RlmE family RNA methyltransferase [Myxococcales bacterium]
MARSKTTTGGRKLDDRAARHDPAYQRAKRENFAARAIFKLEEIDQRFHLLKAGGRVLDLGCWPGSWMQYAVTKVGDTGFVYGVDLRPVTVAFPAYVRHEVADVFTWTPAELGDRIDVVLSDMAPHTTGDRVSDKYRSEELCARALEIARQALRPGGHLVAKVFQGGGFGELLRQWKSAFQEARPFHARDTRATSSEQYLVGRGLLKSAQLEPPPRPAQPASPQAPAR